MFKVVTHIDTDERHVIFDDKTMDRARPLCLIVFPILIIVSCVIGLLISLTAGVVLAFVLSLIAFVVGLLSYHSETHYMHSQEVHDGIVVITEDGGGVKGFSLELDGDPELLAGNTSISFRVRRVQEGAGMPRPPQS